MLYETPPRTGFEIAWTIFGVRFRIFPSFLVFALILALVIVRWNPLAIVVDVACITFAVVFINLAQGMVYRSYGIRSTVLLREFFGGFVPDELPPMALQRIVAALATPAAAFLLFAVVYYSDQALEWSLMSPLLGFAYWILYVIALASGVIHCLPIYPYSGGRVIAEILTLLWGEVGLMITLGISMATGVLYIAYTAAVMSGRMAIIWLTDELPLFANVIVAVFFALTVLQNWAMLGQLAQIRRAARLASQSDQSFDDRP